MSESTHRSCQVRTMKNLPVVFLVFCAIIFVAYSFECYECNENTEEECNSKQTKVNCTGDDFTCVKINFKTDKDKTGEFRGCQPKKFCEEIKKKCDDGEEIAQDDGGKVTKCDAACCVTAAGAENPCNGAITVSVNVVMMILAALYALNLFLALVCLPFNLLNALATDYNVILIKYN